MRKKTRMRCFAAGLAFAVAVSSSGAGLYGGIPKVSAAIWESEGVMTSNAIACGDAESWEEGTKASVKYAGTKKALAEGTKLSFKLTITSEEYATLGEGDYLKVQAVLQQEEKWNEDTLLKMGYPMYKATEFTQNEDETYSVIVDFVTDKKIDIFDSLLIDVVGTHFTGDIDVSDVVFSNPNEIWSAKGADTNEVTFGAAEDWDTWDNTLKATFEGNNKAISAGSVFKCQMKIDEASYLSMKAEDYIKLQAVFFEETDNWESVKKLGYPEYKPSQFTDNGDGTYSTEVELSVQSDIANFASVLLQGVGTGFTGKVTFSNLSITKEEEDVILTPTEPTVIGSFDSDITNWVGETGYQYSAGNAELETKDATTSIEWDEVSQSLKMNLDYSADTDVTWSEAKITGNLETPVNIKNYNVLTFTLRYPSNMDTVRTKIFMQDDAEKEIINGEGSFRTKTVNDLGDGWSTVTIRSTFKPKDTTVNSVTLGIVGPYANLNCVYIDDVKLAQLDASEDYVAITEEVKTGIDTADLSKMATSVKLVDSNASDSTKALAAYLKGLRGSKQVLFGHQNSTFRSVKDNGATSDIKDITGAEAGLFGIDTLSLSGVETSQTTRQGAIDASVAASKKAWENGSIVTLSCHMPNFTSSKIKETSDSQYPYDFTKCDFSESKDLTPCSDYILEGGEYNAQFNAYLDIIADYALELQEENIPVLYRPFHENSGGWFWWGTSTSVDSYKAMWRYMVSYLETKGVHNFLYVYSPNGPISSEAEYLERYPGDAYVDVLAFDYYDDYADVNEYTGDTFFEALEESCQTVASLADKKGKIPAIAESGIRITGAGKDSLMVTGNPTTGKDWYNKLVNTASSNGIPYFLLWANFDSSNFFVPYKYNDTLGQEMINEFIASYNNEKSIFGNGTNFYEDGGAVSKAGTVTLEGYTEATGYMISPKNYAVIKQPCEMKASVKNAQKVEFQIKATQDAKTVVLNAVKAEQGDVYTATLSQADLDELGKTSTGMVTLVADEQILGQAQFINFNKDADVMPQFILDDFEYYYGNDGLLQGKYGTHNSAANCNAAMTHNSEYKVEGSYSGAFGYKLAYKGSEVWTGGLGRVFDADKTDFSKYNAISMWVKPDGNGQKLVMQLNGQYEVYLTDFVKGTKAQYITIPFSKFVKKGTTDTAVDSKTITEFKIWCNSMPENYSGTKDEDGNYTVEGTIYFDDMKAVQISDTDIKKANESGIIVSDSPLEDLSGNKKPDNPTTEEVTTTESQKTTQTTEATISTETTEAEKTPDIYASKMETKKVTIKWKKNDKADGYYVYAYNTSKKKYVKVADTKKTYAKISKISGKKLKSGATYKFKVTAYEKNGKKKNTISESTLKLTTTTAPDKVSLSSVKKKSSNKAVLKWKKVSGASGYEIYMKEGTKGEYKKVKTVKKGKTVSYTENGLKKNTKYYFKVRAYKSVSGKKVYSKFSKVKSIKLK